MGAFFIVIISLVLFVIFGAFQWGREAHENREAQAKKDKLHSWTDRVTDQKLEQELNDFIYDPNNYEEVWDELSEAYAEIPGREKQPFIFLTPESVAEVCGRGQYTKKQREEIASAGREEALRIMMARRGKLLYWDAYSGIHSSGWGAPTRTQAKEINKTTANLVLWINRQLKEHGIDEDVFIDPLETSWFVYPIESDMTRGGTYIWRPALPDGKQIAD